MEEDEETLSIPHRKKKKANRPHVKGIEEEYLTLLSEAVAKVAEKTLGKIVSRQTNWKASITMKVNQLAETVAEVHETMKDESYGVESVDTLETPMLLPPLRI